MKIILFLLSVSGAMSNLTDATFNQPESTKSVVVFYKESDSEWKKYGQLFKMAKEKLAVKDIFLSKADTSIEEYSKMANST